MRVPSSTPGRHLHLQRVSAAQHALSLALGTRILNHRSRALADRAGAGHAEESLLIAHLPLAIALAALAGRLAARGAGALAGVAQLAAPDGDFLLHAECRVFKA